MTQLPTRFTNRLRREPAELLEVARHHYQTVVGGNIHAVFPVVFRQSLDAILLTLVKLGAIAVVAYWAAFFVTGSPSVAMLASIAGSVIGFIMTRSKITYGIVAVMDDDFVLIELNKATKFSSGQVIERINIASNILPKPRRYKGGMLSDALAFGKDGDRGWYYAALTDHGTGYVELLEQLRTFQTATDSQSQTAEPQLIG